MLRGFIVFFGLMPMTFMAQSVNKKDVLIDNLFKQIRFIENIDKVLYTYYNEDLGKDKWDKFLKAAKKIKSEYVDSIREVYRLNYTESELKSLLDYQKNNQSLFLEENNRVKDKIVNQTTSFEGELERLIINLKID